jgi:hypothetical protein
MGITTALLYERFSRTKLPSYLAFFGGRRLVPILAGCAAVINGVVFGLFWPVLGRGFNALGNWIVAHAVLGAGVYGVINRLLVPTGLHHIPNSLVWFTFGEYNGKTGDLHRFFAGDPTAGGFMTGFFPIMMFALPAACLAMIHTARPERRKAIAGLLGLGRAHLVPHRDHRADRVRVRLRGTGPVRRARRADRPFHGHHERTRRPRRLHVLGRIHRLGPELRRAQPRENLGSSS